MRLSQRLSQNLQVPSVTSCYNDDKAVLICFNLIEAVIEIFAYYCLLCIRKSFGIGIFFPVINNRNLKIHMSKHRLKGKGNMSPAEYVGLA